MYNTFFYNGNKELRPVWVATIYFLCLPLILLFYLVIGVVRIYQKIAPKVSTI